LELVYLWVEDYKNIQKQGFNFSPRFTCDYDGKELTIKENDDYIENFFGKNINVTAIVGKNGSGKSSVLEFILLSIQKFDMDKSLFIFYDKDVDKLIIRHNFIKFFLINEILFNEIKPENENYETFFKDLKSMFPFFNYSFTYNNSIGEDELFPKFPKKELGKISLLQEEKENLQTIISNHALIKKKKKSYIFDDFFKVDSIRVYFSNFFHHLLMKDRETPRGEALVKLNNEAVDLFFEDKSEKALKVFVGLLNGIYSEAPNNKNKDEYYLDMKKSIENLDLPNSLFLKNKQSFPITIPTEKLLIDSLHRRYNFPDYRSNSSINENGMHQIYSADDFNLNEDIQKGYLFFEWDINQLEEFEIQSVVNFFSNSFFLIEIIDKENKSLKDLSFGELQLLTILNKILSFSINNKDVNNFFLLLDEIDIGFHPDWQKRTIKYIIDFLSLIPDKNFHLIFTTHSPFLLSDIPKKNIIFLNEKTTIKQTFGANIHTLLSDSFFMDDGLMGEFAKGKINEIIDFHKLVEKNRHTNCLTKIYLDSKQKKFWDIQKIIGEDYLKQVIKNHLVEIEKSLLGVDEAKKEEIKRVEAYLESLKK
jgi:predicted ATPase